MYVTNYKARNKFVSSILLLETEITSQHVILYWSAYSHSSVYTQQLFSMHFPPLLVTLFFSQLCLTHNSYLPSSSLEIANSMTMISSFFLSFHFQCLSSPIFLRCSRFFKSHPCTALNRSSSLLHSPEQIRITLLISLSI